jgi:phage pi2 protein 07
MSSVLCWFQMKGIMAKSLSADSFHSRSHIKLPLKVKHLRYWFLQPMPTYLAFYVESIDKFFILNIQDYITHHWGRSILSLHQKTVAVLIPADSVLVEQAFYLILVKSDISEWRKVLDAEEADLRLCRRDYNLIWHLGTASERRVKHRIVFWDWQSKTRSQFYIQERPLRDCSQWKTLREHW